jgi:hypothetical protein
MLPFRTGEVATGVSPGGLLGEKITRSGVANQAYASARAGTRDKLEAARPGREAIPGATLAAAVHVADRRPSSALAGHLRAVRTHGEPIGNSAYTTKPGDRTPPRTRTPAEAAAPAARSRSRTLGVAPNGPPGRRNLPVGVRASGLCRRGDTASVVTSLDGSTDGPASPPIVR